MDRTFTVLKFSKWRKIGLVRKTKDGFVNEYRFNTDNLKIINLLYGNHSVLNLDSTFIKKIEFLFYRMKLLLR